MTLKKTFLWSRISHALPLPAIRSTAPRSTWTGFTGNWKETGRQCPLSHPPRAWKSPQITSKAAIIISNFSSRFYLDKRRDYSTFCIYLQVSLQLELVCFFTSELSIHCTKSTRVAMRSFATRIFPCFFNWQAQTLRTAQPNTRTRSDSPGRRTTLTSRENSTQNLRFVFISIHLTSHLHS